MENENKRKYWFFGSKLNSVLLLILIVLMVVALKWMFDNKQAYIPVIKREYNETPIKIKDKYTGNNKDDTLGFINLPFFKSLIKEGPDSVIFECNLLGKKYFQFNFDKVENGSHVVGSQPVIYSLEGDEIESCSINPSVSQSSLCKELMKPNVSCKEIYVKNGYEGSVDVYNLAK
jgi:hypothetical protein